MQATFTTFCLSLSLEYTSFAFMKTIPVTKPPTIMLIKKIFLPAVLMLLLGGGIWYYAKGSSAAAGGGKEQSKSLTTTVKKGEFKIFVNATGELKAKNSLEIKGPAGMRSANIWQATISDMVPEGTMLKAGDYVATLDRTELETKIKEAQNEIDKINTQLDQATIDTTIELRGLRDELINMKFGMEEKKLQVEQSKYEPKMVIQQAEIDLQRSERDYTQLQKKYELTQTKAKAKISEILASLNQFKLRMQRLVDVSNEFVVKAPKAGMLIYARSWNGKIGPGSQISSWDPTVAELPDMSTMISKTFVNEVDISRVKKGQEVNIKVDAFPDKDYTGSVIMVANVGEQLRGYDSKVFEVTVQVNEADSILRPAMTTSNEVLTFTFQDVLHIPLEALQNNDSLSYVFTFKDGKTSRREVVTGETNDNEVIVEHGLEENEEVLLTLPDGHEKMPLVPLDPKIKEEIKKKLVEEKKKREEEAEKRMKEMKEEYQPKNESGGGNVIIFG